MKLSRAAIVLYIGLVFASGSVLGFFANRLYNASTAQAKPAPKNPQEFRNGLVTFYKNRLQLNLDQVQKLEFILDDITAQYQATFKEERERSRPELNGIHDQQIQRIKAMLNPSQLEEYDKVLKERELQRQQKKNNHSNGPGF